MHFYHSHVVGWSDVFLHKTSVFVLVLDVLLTATGNNVFFLFFFKTTSKVILSNLGNYFEFLCKCPLCKFPLIVAQ